MRKGEYSLVFPILLAIVCIVLGLQCRNLSKEAVVFPLFCVGMILLLVFLLILNNIFSKTQNETQIQPDFSRIRISVYFFIAVFIYILLLKWIGYLCASFISLSGSMLLLKVKPISKVLLSSVGFTLFSYIVFGLLFKISVFGWG